MSRHSAELSEALSRISAVPRLLVALDFDGTLAPTVDQPEEARANSVATDAILDLVALPATTVALVSGRALDSLERVARVPREVVLVGSHGAEFRIDGNDTGPELSAEEQDVLSRLCDTIRDVASHYVGTMTEIKPAGCGLHSRLAAQDTAAAVEAHALRAVAGMRGGDLVSHRRGKDILEFTVRAADKGTALTTLRERCDVSAVMFVGDDVTDEDAFAVLRDGDVGIKVGEGETAAQYRVPDTDAVADLLADFVTTRMSTRA
jgi:trehalose 6-phosphate phosphatase